MTPPKHPILGERHFSGPVPHQFGTSSPPVRNQYGTVASDSLSPSQVTVCHHRSALSSPPVVHRVHYPPGVCVTPPGICLTPPPSAPASGAVPLMAVQSVTAGGCERRQHHPIMEAMDR